MNYSNDYVYNAIIDLLDHALIMNGLRSIYQSIILSYIYTYIYTYIYIYIYIYVSTCICFPFHIVQDGAPRWFINPMKASKTSMKTS